MIKKFLNKVSAGCQKQFSTFSMLNIRIFTSNIFEEKKSNKFVYSCIFKFFSNKLFLEILIKKKVITKIENSPTFWYFVLNSLACLSEVFPAILPN